MSTTVLKGAAKSWTIWFAVALTFFGFLQLQSEEIGKLVGPYAQGWFNIIVGACVAVLRALTSVSLAEKGEGNGEG